ncbi:hypothetical protein NXW65_24350 [Bacteroides thetaiotaomicron]|nr:hypothetical protein [Bacteroides thetaiotaomicron]
MVEGTFKGSYTDLDGTFVMKSCQQIN